MAIFVRCIMRTYNKFYIIRETLFGILSYCLPEFHSFYSIIICVCVCMCVCARGELYLTFIKRNVLLHHNDRWAWAHMYYVHERTKIIFQNNVISLHYMTTRKAIITNLPFYLGIHFFLQRLVSCCSVSFGNVLLRLWQSSIAICYV